MKQASLKTPTDAQHPILQRIHETFFILICFFAAYLLIAILTYYGADPGWSTTGSNLQVANAGGRLGAFLADILLFSFGYLAVIFPFSIGYFAWLFHQKKKGANHFDYRVFILKIFSFVLLVSTGTGLMSLLIPSWPNMPFTSGGMIGEILIGKVKALLNPMGTLLTLWSLCLISVSLFTGLSWLQVMDKTGHILIQMMTQLAARIMKLQAHIQADRLMSQKERMEPTIEPGVAFSKTNPKKLPRVEPKITAIPDVDQEPLIAPKPKKLAPLEITKPQDVIEKTVVPILALKGGEHSTLPPIHLLDMANNASNKRYSHATLETMSREVELRLMDFGVQVQVVAVHPGPVITRFELSLAPGLKVSKITNLAKDLARSLSVVSVRIVDVIPGKSVVGLEVPNEHREMVCLREILTSAAYEQSRSPLTLALGKDISGHSVVVDLGKMPHLLVAGTTGSGKSVGVNVMLLSLLYKSTPEKVRLIMIDPKMLELSIYEGIPHLLAPVVTDMKDAANALRWCVAEMERRYRLMASLGVRNLAGFNTKIEEATTKGSPILNPLPLSPDQTPEPLSTLPYIVVVIDEFADMMMVVGKKVEELIARIAQKARAAGIHMILATQRPSVDVITGLIKANIPTRIAFQVSSRIDSRTILDQQGAEQLLGYGDMLYLAAGTGIPVRVHGAYAADHEVHAVVNYIKQQGTPDYLPEILDSDDMAGDSQITASPTGEQDPLYDQAVQIVLQSRRASVSNIQRRLKIGYNRAARIVEDMEVAGIVSAMGQNGNREVLVESHEEMA
jgi:S-DNA-T family DNA segregation ATPase FtsK/SpoIIIE